MTINDNNFLIFNKVTLCKEKGKNPCDYRKAIDENSR